MDRQETIRIRRKEWRRQNKEAVSRHNRNYYEKNK